ncbi:unnamed protein product [Parnassius apollo]|uniref:(apollo) hypothetical protein n=1 Tax=Parnassius apollo TaxID=110799 RepID=A0A8S3WIF2_PARAO|nr:unnamed protein product [Parnassius apollo]
MELASEAEIEEKYCNTQGYGYESSEEQETRKTVEGSRHQDAIVAETVIDKEKTSDIQEEGNILIGTQEVRKPVEESRDLPIAAETVCDNNKRNTTQENSSKYLLDDLRISDSSDDGDFGSSSSDDYICATDESSSSSDNERTSAKKKRTTTSSVRHTSNITVPETPPSPMSTSENPVPGCSFWERNGMNSAGKKKKTRKSVKERRQDRARRKLFRNTGLEYITTSGKTKKRRQLHELENCRQKCKQRLPQDLREKLFKQYWSLGSYENRTKYIAKCIEVCQKKTSKLSPKKKRNVSFRYFVHGFDHTKHPICKGCFLKTFDESHKYLQTVCEKLRDNGGHLPQRKRRVGKSIPDFKLEEIKEHIACFPCTESHYGRNKTTKKFLNSELNLQVLYNLYKLKTDAPVSKTIFKKVFETMNLSFKKPSVDTCSKCDRINMKLKYASVDQAANLIETFKEHQEAFKAAYEEKKADKQLAQSSEVVAVITFDLQQCLPTPYLQTNVAFYKRQLWTFNLTIHDLKTNKAFCYMWPECEGNRGANDIASCLYDFIINQLPNLHPNAKKLIMFSDSCSGQNKNSIVTTMLMLVTRLSPQLQFIEHKFLVPGHTHMEADTDHALIERKKKITNMDIHLPRDWYQLVRTASNKTAKFTVIEMTHEMFYDFNIFVKQSFTFRKTNTANEKFLWLNVRSVLYNKENISCFSYKKEFKDVEYLTMDCSKRGKTYDNIFTINMVPKAYHSKLPISTDKKKDLLNLLCFIHESAHEFYRSLSCKNDVKDSPADNDDDSDGE